MMWYYADAGAQKGPVNEQKFKELAAAGTIAPTTLVWREGMADWKPYSEVAGPPAAVAPPPPPDVTPPAAAVSAPMVAPGGPADAINALAAFHYAGFWIRVVAKILDGLLLTVVNLPVQVLVMMFVVPGLAAGGDPAANGIILLINLFVMFFQIAVGVAYNVFFVGKYGATPGKMALSLKVIRADGSKVTYGRALGRAFAEYLSGLILGIGYIIAGFDVEKRTLHDHICDTRVIRD